MSVDELDERRQLAEEVRLVDEQHFDEALRLRAVGIVVAEAIVVVEQRRVAEVDRVIGDLAREQVVVLRTIQNARRFLDETREENEQLR